MESHTSFIYSCASLITLGSRVSYYAPSHVTCDGRDAEIVNAHAQERSHWPSCALAFHKQPLAPSFPANPSAAYKLLSSFAYSDSALAWSSLWLQLAFVQSIDGAQSTALVSK